MAFSNTYDVTSPGSAVGNREQLLNVLSVLAPEETPMTSLAKKSKATATFVEWTVDSLSAPVTAGIAEGADVSSFTDKFAARGRIGNYIQKFRRDFKVSDLQQAVDSVGPANLAQAEMKAVRELKRDIEATICSDNDRAAEDGAGTAYALRGFGDWIDSAGPADVPSAYRTPASSIHASGLFNEDDLNSLVTSIFRENGMSNRLTLLADTALRRLVSKFTRADTSSNDSTYTVTEPASGKKITFTVSVYESDHGIISIINANPDCMPADVDSGYGRGYLVNPDYLGIAELIPVGSTMLENQGGGERGYVDAACTLIVNHPGAHGKITDITG